MSSSARIDYSVIFASSSDTGHSEKELEIRNNNNKSPEKRNSNGTGWQSARFCEYPQYLVIHLSYNMYQITQIQLLSHRSKIASKIEIWVAQDSNLNHNHSSYNSIAWQRLGYLSLSKNEESNWKARELKSVYIEKQANYLKFALHESHVNSLNLFNQVGIVALSIFGCAIGHMTTTVINTDCELDEKTQQQITDLIEEKRIAVENEEYDDAKRCKMLIERLKSNAMKLKSLYEQKKEAVADEDYDLAKVLKLQIQQIQCMSIEPNVEHQPQQQSFNMHSYQPQYQPSSPQQSMMIDNKNSRQSMNNSMNVDIIDEQQCISPLIEQSHMPNYQRSIERQIRPMGGESYAIVNENTVDAFGRSASVSVNVSPIKPSVVNNNSNRSPMVIMQDMNDNRNVNGGIVNTTSIHKSNDMPPELKAGVRKGSESMIEVFGENIVRYLYSPNWSQRDIGLQKIAECLQKKQHPDMREVFKLAAKLIYKSLQDRVAKIFFRGIEVLNILIELYATSIKAEDVARFCHPCVLTLINTLGHSHSRMVDASGTMLVTLAQVHVIVCKSIFNDICKPMKVSLPKHLKGRGVVLFEMIQQFDIPSTIDLSVLFSLIKPLLLNKDGDVRNIGVQLCTLVYERVNMQMVPYVQGLNDFLKESLNSAFKEISGHENVLERDPKSVKEQSRPSKTMRNSKPRTQVSKRGGRNSRGRGRNRSRGRGRGRNRNRGRGRGRGKSGQQRDAHMIEDRKENHSFQSNSGPTAMKVEMDAQYTHDSSTMSNNMNVDTTDVNQIAEQMDTCNFCGLRDNSFLENEENLDVHYWQSCPMLTSCKLCEQVIEIPTLFEHMLTECDSDTKHVLCKRCHVPYTMDDIDEHIASNSCEEALPMSQANKCPLCLENIPPSESGWNMHLLKYPGCKSNPRKLM